MLGAIVEVALVETGDRTARERWQHSQLRNLLKHARERSAFWRKRLAGKSASELEVLPALTRRELIEQVGAEGCLLSKQDGIQVEQNATSGSSGTPVTFFVSAVNAQYNIVRSAAQYFIEGRDISLNRTRLTETYKPHTAKGISVDRSASWLGPLSTLFKSGANRRIDYRVADVGKLAAELQKQDVGYLVCPPRILESIFSHESAEFLKQAKTRMWICVNEGASPDLLKTFSRLQIPVRSAYSAEEVGAIGFECPTHAGHFHIASSNVLVETDTASYEVGETRVGRLLVTHLHSYATPFIRYDLGDLGCLRRSCPCGHDGPTLYNLFGRQSALLKHADGRLSPFHIRSAELIPLAEFTEFKIRQTALDKIVVEIGGRTELAPKEFEALHDLFKKRAGAEFTIDIRPCREIEWGEGRKWLGFRCEIA